MSVSRTNAEHRHRAEDLLHRAQTGTNGAGYRDALIAAAHVHATLALGKEPTE